MIKGLAHICFGTRDLDGAITFYCDKLGLERAFDFRNDDGERFGIYIRLGGRNFLEIFNGEPKDPGGHCYLHCCLEVDDVHATVDQLRSKGVEVTDAVMGIDNSWQAWLNDPDGNRIELHEYTPKSWQAPHLQ